MRKDDDLKVMLYESRKSLHRSLRKIEMLLGLAVGMIVALLWKTSKKLGVGFFGS